MILLKIFNLNGFNSLMLASAFFRLSPVPSARCGEGTGERRLVKIPRSLLRGSSLKKYYFNICLTQTNEGWMFKKEG
jgi:hypothetical protein